MFVFKEYLYFDDAGVKPVYSCESRWVPHKLNALKLASPFKVWCLHESSSYIVRDRFVKAADHAKLAGYCKKLLSTS